ncbi:MAG: carboxypeptidase regulatory-like domain-containing protein [Verrucomicrobia bacterium]|nr:carboxypeptidase regulatory-like domain-containing protein [Verrucomicrobiota bacterium]
MRRLIFLVAGLLALAARAEPVDFHLPAKSAAEALLDFSKQARVDVLFSFDALRKEQSTEVVGRFEPEEALALLLKSTRFKARQNGAGKFIVIPASPPTGTLRGRVVESRGSPVRGARLDLPEARQTVVSNRDGEFEFPAIAPGTYALVARGAGFQPQSWSSVIVEADRVRDLGALTIQIFGEPARLAPFLVESKRDRSASFDPSSVPLPPRTAIGNLDLPRTQSDALPFHILDRTRISRSGVVNLNDFLRRELLDSDPSKLPLDQDGGKAGYIASSANLALRGFGDADETIIMVNGRRLPEILTSGGDKARMPDVNFIPLSLVQQVEVLPVSAASLYNGNPVGGVINIVLRPAADMNITETTATYTNALHRYDAPQSSLALTHMRTLLGGALRLSLNANFTRSLPPTESELRYFQARNNTQLPSEWPLFRATPNIRSFTTTPDGRIAMLSLFGPGTPAVASVAPGAEGNGGLAALTTRQGVRNFDFFDSRDGFATSSDSVDYVYGRRQRREAVFGSIVADLTPWLEVGLDGTIARTIVHRGADVIWGDFDLRAASPYNPFKQDAKVSLFETAPLLGENYNEARLQFASAVLGLLFKLPRDWRASLDTQFAHNLTKYRALSAVDRERWQALVDSGKYNPFRDTQVFGPPPEFYDQVLVYNGGPNRFVTLGDYGALDVSFRAMNESLSFPTGRGAVNVGADYRRTYLAKYREVPRYGDGSAAGAPIEWAGRTLQRYSAFGEARAPLAPESRLPSWLRRIEADLAVRYIAANSGRESYVAPTLSFKADFRGGLALRSSFTSSNRYPTPQMSRPFFTDTGGPPPDLYREEIKDPRRGGEKYHVISYEEFAPVLSPESAATQAAGLIFQRGKTHRVRATLDFVDTRKTNEIVGLDAQPIVDLERLFPDRIVRAPATAADPQGVGRIVSVLRGVVNQAWRHSQNWNATGDYSWTECFGGTFDLYGRLLVFQSYKLEHITGSGVVDALYHPDTSDLGLLRYRANFGASWSTRDQAYGLDGHYYHSRKLPVQDWPSQGHRQIRPFWQFDAYVQQDIGRWLPWFRDGRGLNLQVRVNNIFRSGFPINRLDPSGVQPYGDWRDRTYSLSLTATF